AFASVMYNQSSTSSVTAQSSDTYSSTDTRQDNSYSYAGQKGYNPSDGYTVSSNASYSAQDTATGGATLTEQSVGSASVYQAGNFSNYSYALSSFALTQQGGDTLTASSSDNYTSTAIELNWPYSNTGSFTRTGGGSDASAATQTDGWTLSEQGSFAAGSFALSSYGFAEQQGSSDNVNDSGNWTDTFSGSNYSGGDSGSQSDNRSSSDNGSLSELGSDSNGSLTLNTVSYNGSGSANASAQDGESGSWSGVYSGTANASAQWGNMGNYAVSSLGSYSNGSWSLSSYVLQGGSNGSSTSGAGEQDTERDGRRIRASSQNFSRSVQESNTLYQSGAETAGAYANVSYNSIAASGATLTEQTAIPSHTSVDSWQSAQTTTETLSGEVATAAATFGFVDTNFSGNGASSSRTTPSVTLPGTLVSFSGPDGSSVPVAGADESSGAMPVPASPQLGSVRVTSEQLFAAGESAKEAAAPTSTILLEPPASGGSSTLPPPPSDSGGPTLRTLPMLPGGTIVKGLAPAD
ncbi:MAG: hypothetical protein ACREQ5_15735, partial [Candidatus Dormibacteria bacterium]